MPGAVHLVVPGPLNQRTGGYIYDRRIVEELRAQGVRVAVHELAGAFPAADTVAEAAAQRSLGELGPADLLLIDGLALPAFERHADRLPGSWVALVHHPLPLETGIAADEAARLAALERRLLPSAARIIVTSPQTRRDLEAYDIGSARVGVVLPGTQPGTQARGSGGPGATLLCIASLTPRKGHLVLLEALGRLLDLDWRLVCIGSAARDPGTFVAISGAIERLGLRRRVELVGERPEDALEPFYAGADVFVLASHHEGYGMALAEAMARGLPVVSTTAGAISDTVPATAGILVPPGDVDALAVALRRVISEPDFRAQLAKGARAARTRLYDWPEAARRFARELERVWRGGRI